MADNTLILASASPRRRQLLGQLGVTFDVCACPLSEPVGMPAGIAPIAWAEALAYFKARAVGETHAGRWVLGADTIVACGGEVLGKPRDREDARRMLELQAGLRSDVITGVCLVRCGGGIGRLLAHCVTGVWMRDDREQREAYLAGSDWRGKAGAYGIQNVGDRLVDRVMGSFSNVVGLPRGLVRRMLEVLRVEPGAAGQSTLR